MSQPKHDAGESFYGNPDKWGKEFEAFGLSRICLNKTQLDILH